MTKPARSPLLLFLFGGLLPVISFALVEEYYGVLWGCVAGMVFGIGEILYEKIALKTVSGITWFSNALILILGGLSLISEDGIWFKLQPALVLLCFGAIVVGSSIINRPLLTAMALKQRPDLPLAALEMLTGLNFRVGILFLALAGLSTWAAYSWSTEAWAFLKSFGVLIILVLYIVGETLIRRFLGKRL